MGNILGGQAGGSTGCTDQNTTGFASPTSSPASNIIAVILFGDVTHVANQTYNTANGTAYNGVSAGPMLLDKTVEIYQDS